MSEQQSPESPKSNKSPQGDKPEGGVNWKVIILFTIAIAIIYIAFNNAGDGKVKTPSFARLFLKDEFFKRPLMTIKKGSWNW